MGLGFRVQPGFRGLGIRIVGFTFAQPDSAGLGKGRFLNRQIVAQQHSPSKRFGRLAVQGLWFKFT